MIQSLDLETTIRMLENKVVAITNTNSNEFAFSLAHFIRNHTKLLYCFDSTYKMTQESEGYRIIEKGKVILIKGIPVDIKTEAIYRVIGLRPELLIEIK